MNRKQFLAGFEPQRVKIGGKPKVIGYIKDGVEARRNDTETGAKTEAAPEPRIMVDYRPGQWGKVFHIFDLDNREIALHQKDTVKMARNVLKIAKEQK